VQDPITLSQLKHEHEVRRAIAQQQHAEQQQQQLQHGGNRDQYLREMQRQRMMAAAMGNGNGPQQQQPIRPGPPGQGMPQGQGQPRLGPNGQPLPPIAASQQQILNAVAAATAANRQAQGQGQNTPGGSVRPLPQQGQGGPMQQGQQRVPVQQMQQVEAQMLAAQMVQARAQQAQNQRAASAGGTPQSQPGNLAATPYQGMSDLSELNGEGIAQHLQSSPAIINAQLGMHSSPQGRPGQMPMVQAPHLRAQSAGSPQMGNGVSGPQMNAAIVTQIAAQIQASGGQPTPEAIRAHWTRYMQGVRLFYTRSRRELITRFSSNSNSTRRLRRRRRHRDKDKYSSRVRLSRVLHRER
jgi:chromatin modification-related protein VID21